MHYIRGIRASHIQPHQLHGGGLTSFLTFQQEVRFSNSILGPIFGGVNDSRGSTLTSFLQIDIPVSSTFSGTSERVLLTCKKRMPYLFSPFHSLPSRNSTGSRSSRLPNSLEWADITLILPRHPSSSDLANASSCASCSETRQRHSLASATSSHTRNLFSFWSGASLHRRSFRLWHLPTNWRRGSIY